jgi:hypothetical protein
MNIKQKIIKWLGGEKKLDLEEVYLNNQHFFELRLLKDFVGYIPKDVSEPTLNIFKDHGEAMERWTLWQSWYINGRYINDPKHIEFSHGMMVYLKMLNTMAKLQKKNFQPAVRQVQNEEVVASSFIDKALEGLKEFQDGNTKNNQTNQGSQGTENAEV